MERCLRTGITVEAGIGQIVLARRLSSGQRRNGRPVFIPGQKDSLTRIREVEKALLRTRGPEGFDIDVAPADRAMMAQIYDREEPAEDAEDGLVIDHEGSAAINPSPVASHGRQQRDDPARPTRGADPGGIRPARPASPS